MRSIDRRHFLALAAAMPALPQTLAATQPIVETHFPSRLYCFVWRNWELANLDRMAQVLSTDDKTVLALGRSMGLSRKPHLTRDQLRRIYVTVIRQNWHLLPEKQLIQLLGWDQRKFDFTLKEDDFLDVKLGRNKPKCEELKYALPSANDRKRAEDIKRIVTKTFGQDWNQPGQALFQFVEELGAPGIQPPIRKYLRETSVQPGPMQYSVEREGIFATAPDDAALQQLLNLLDDEVDLRESLSLPVGKREFKPQWSPRFLYSYQALYGDPLIDPSTDPFPAGYLEKVAKCGVTGVWLQGVLNTLAPSMTFPEFGDSWQTRLRNLSIMCHRAAEFGLKIFLYMNEPRSMPEEFFSKRAGLRGEPFQDLHSLCTSTTEVQDWITASLAHVFRYVPQLGGIFTISMSENHTNCFSHGGAWGKNAPSSKVCPRCSKRESWDVLAELFHAMREGVRKSSRTAEIIHWDWGWPDDMAAKLIPKLDKDVMFMSISEWSQPVKRGGVETEVGEYSISVTGPGPRAKRNWQIAREAGLKTMAKVQFNNTWEISAVPYIPVPHLIVEHCEELRKAGVRGVMASWTCGGYPSPNLMAAKPYYFQAEPDQAQVLKNLAVQRFGGAAASDGVEAWRMFSEAFREFPYGVNVYLIPTQHGPANLLRLKSTGHAPGMILFPHDVLKQWCGKYPVEVVQQQFRLLASKWKQGLPAMERAVAKAPPSKQRNAKLDLAIAMTCANHFESVANQVEFYRLREAGASDKARMRALAEAELELAKSQYSVARSQSTIAYEATNHYYYTPLDLAEKVLNCTEVMEQLAG